MTRAFQRRDASYDGIFYICVRTTGVFCRPSCPARKPRSRNVEYRASVRAALLAGYRPCKRCRPLDTNGRAPGWVAELLSYVAAEPAAALPDERLRAAGFDPTRVRRYFRENYGMTFQSYHRDLRMGLALGELRRGAELDQVALDYGYESHSGFRSAFTRAFGRPPGKAREVTCIVASRLESPLGPLEVAATPDGVCLLEFADRRALATQWKTLRRRLGAAIVPGRNEHIERLASELEAYFAGGLRRFATPLVIAGTAFQETVWRRLLRIPYGATMSYEGLARAIGRPGAQRAVGKANGDNRLAIVIPCHRVVQKDGQLRGYGGGLWRKKRLLELEGA